MKERSAHGNRNNLRQTLNTYKAWIASCDWSCVSVNAEWPATEIRQG